MSALLVVAIALLGVGPAVGLVPGTSSRPPSRPALSIATLHPFAATPAGATASASAPASAVATAAPVAAALEAPSEAVSTPAPTEVPSSPISSGYRITIPRLGIDLQIREGDLTRDIEDQHTPEGYAFHLPGTAWPGQNGNTYLYAHARRGMFLALWNVRPGDEVFILAPNGQVLVYVVRDILPRVTPTDVSSTQPTTTERLTLQTSTGPYPSDPRFVVFAFPRGG